MTILLMGLTVWVGGALAALAFRHARASIVGAGVALAGGVLILVQALVVLTGETVSWRCGWGLPFGEVALHVDALAAWFLLPICVVSMLAAVYGVRYLRPQLAGRHAGWVWFNYNLLAASMVTVVVARNAILFLVAWEAMALASFFLVLFDAQKREVREAGWLYLVASHLGTAFLLAMFVLMGREAGSMDFDAFARHAGAVSPVLTGLLFLLAVVGFGAKAGFMPLHIWLPEAHPAPSHVSAVLSGVMIKTGIYGLLRMLTLLGPPPVWWGVALLAIGMSSGVMGVLFALAQHDLKRMLAYSSVENIGIIAMGIGLGPMPFGNSLGQQVTPVRRS